MTAQPLLRRPLRAAARLAQAGAPDRRLVLYTAFRGDYADNPRALFEVLRDRLPDHRHVWVIGHPESLELLPAGVERVRYGSVQHVRALSRAGVVVANTALPPWWRKKPGVFYLQTWHGTPLKRIGFDVPTGDPAFFDDVARDRLQWDCLLSPTPEISELLRRAFRYDGPIAETGYPRNDALHAADAAERGAALRAALGVAPDRRLVLYAPTREDEAVAGRRPAGVSIDAARFVERLGKSHTLVVRRHPSQRAQPAPAGVVDATRYPDMRDLLLAADVLVTDYSSACFDAVGAGKPVVFFMPERERFEGRERGLYFDVDDGLLPGPIVTTEDAAYDVLERDGFAVDEARAHAFRQRFSPLDDGRAAERVLDLVLRPALERVAA